MIYATHLNVLQGCISISPPVWTNSCCIVWLTYVCFLCELMDLEPLAFSMLCHMSKCHINVCNMSVYIAISFELMCFCCLSNTPISVDNDVYWIKSKKYSLAWSYCWPQQGNNLVFSVYLLVTIQCWYLLSQPYLHKFCVALFQRSMAGGCNNVFVHSHIVHQSSFPIEKLSLQCWYTITGLGITPSLLEIFACSDSKLSYVSKAWVMFWVKKH